MMGKKKKNDIQEVSAEDLGLTQNEEQMMRRQSAPRPTDEEGMTDIINNATQKAPDGSKNGLKVLGSKVTSETVKKAYQTLTKYKEGKKNLEDRIVENEKWYKLRHWECMRKNEGEVKPVSAWLFNCIANKHADAMDNFPSPNVLPREEGDKGEALKLSSIIPVILDQNNFEEVYSDTWTYKLRSGTGVYGVFWDGSKLNGLGDISIKKVDLINLFWEPGITDIQQSKNVFQVELVDNESLVGMYPELEGKLGTSTLALAKYAYDDNVDTSEKSAVVDWYYKRQVGTKTVLHYCKFVNDTVLFATENEPEYAERGWYDHGLYPFVFDVLYSVEGTPCGFGYIDIGKDAQGYIDRGNQAIFENLLAGAKPRFFIRADGSVSEEEYADLNNDFVHVDGNLGQDSIMPINPFKLDGNYVTVLNNKVDELKEVTGNRDISTGGTSSGVTAASAIAAMQEAGSKLSRDNSKAAYRAYRKIILMVVELIRQFYDMPRCFRIMGQDGAERYVSYSNENIVAQSQGMDFGVDFGDRTPLFDIEITAQKSSPYSKMSQNELALQFFQAGIFNPALADQAMACLDMMDFDRKNFIMQKIAQNGGMYQQMMMMQQQIAMLEQIAGVRGQGTPPQGVQPPMVKPESVDTDIKEEGEGESSVTKNARERVANSTAPQ